jgi:hypothetical protein
MSLSGAAHNQFIAMQHAIAITRQRIITFQIQLLYVLTISINALGDSRGKSIV